MSLTTSTVPGTFLALLSPAEQVAILELGTRRKHSRGAVLMYERDPGGESRVSDYWAAGSGSGAKFTVNGGGPSISTPCRSAAAFRRAMSGGPGFGSSCVGAGSPAVRKKASQAWFPGVNSISPRKDVRADEESVPRAARD